MRILLYEPSTVDASSNAIKCSVVMAIMILNDACRVALVEYNHRLYRLWYNYNIIIINYILVKYKCVRA